MVRSHRVVVPDLPGLGRSKEGLGSLDDESVTEWLRRTIDETCSEPPVLVGHSLGGGVAARLAITHPEVIERVVLIDSASISRPNRPSPSVMVALIRFGARPTHANHERFLRRVLFDPQQTAEAWGVSRWEAFERYDIELAKDKEVSAASGQLLRRVAGRRIPPDQLARITMPVALIWGSHDRLMRSSIGTRAAARFGWPLFPIDRCGHAPHIEHPGPTVEALERAINVR